MKKRILLKVGTNTLTRESNQISRGKIEDIARQIASLKDEYDFVIVSSGAIATAHQFVKLEGGDTNITEKQALASIGQLHLMRIYQECFRELGLLISQCLLSYADFSCAKSTQNIRNTIDVLLKNGYIPVINENDTVAYDEIHFGDNDRLAALSAEILNIDLLLIATNTNGIYSKESMEKKQPETIKEVQGFEHLLEEVCDTKSSLGTGGMKSKVEAVEIACKAGIVSYIVNGLKDNFIVDALAEKSAFTKIIPVKS